MLFWYSLLVSVAFWQGSIDPATVLRWPLMAVGAALLLFLRAEGPPRPLGGLGIVCLTTLCLTALWSPDVHSGVEGAARLCILAMVFCLGANESDLKQAWAGFALGVSISAAVGLAQHFGWHGVQQTVDPGGLFMHKNMFAEAGAVALIIAVAYRFWWAVPGALLAVILGTSRAAAGAVVLVAILAIPWHRGWRNALLAALGCLAILPFLVGNMTAGVRMDIWRDAVTGLTPMGHGLASFTTNFPMWEFVHNEFLQAAYEFGILAAVPAIIAIYLLRNSHGIERYIFISILGISFFSFPLHMPLTAFAAALAAGHLARRCSSFRAGSHALGMESASGIFVKADADLGFQKQA